MTSQEGRSFRDIIPTKEGSRNETSTSPATTTTTSATTSTTTTTTTTTTTSTEGRKRKRLKTSLGTPKRYLNWKANKRVVENLERLSWSFWCQQQKHTTASTRRHLTFWSTFCPNKAILSVFKSFHFKKESLMTWLCQLYLIQKCVTNYIYWFYAIL